MREFTSLSGFIAVKLTSADIPSLLQSLTRNNIILFRVQQDKPLSVIVWVRRNALHNLRNIAKKRGAELTVIKRNGIYWVWKSLIRRPVLIIGMVCILFLSWFIPTRVLFVTVEGNTSIPTKLILEKAAACGIKLGADRREIRSEMIKNKLLEVLPEIQWAGINTYGCAAVISVSEKTSPKTSSETRTVTSIVAGRDGIINSCTVTSGNLVCKVGQVVQAGQILVSGYTDCGIKIRATRAKAEIFATTVRHLTVISPLDYKQKGEIYLEKTSYSLVLEKNRINLSKDSGISGSVCDKMYSQYYCVLPGGFQLPFAIAVEKMYYRKADSIIDASDISQQISQDYAEEYLIQNMLSGSIVGKLENTSFVNASYVLSGSYLCQEMIGRERNEEIIEYHG